MNMKRSIAPIGKTYTMNRRLVPSLFLAALTVGIAVLSIRPVSAIVDPVTHWNTTAVQAFVTAGQSIAGYRTLAIVQAAVHDALNAIDARYERYAFTGNAQPGASVDAAVAAATRDALVGAIAVGALPFTGFGSVATQTAAMGQVNLAYTAALAAIPDGPSKSDGIAIGQASAAAILALRSTDHALEFVPYTPGTEPGDWRPTPNPVPPSPAAGGPGLAAAALPGGEASLHSYCGEVVSSSRMHRRSYRKSSGRASTTK